MRSPFNQIDLSEPTRKVAIQFRHVSYGVKQQQILRNLHLHVYEGEMLVLLGTSGCGKTTTLKLINRSIEPSDGEVIVEGRSTQQWQPIALRRRIGYTIQETGLFPHFSVARNIALVPTLEGWHRDRIVKRVRELLELVGLEPQKFAQRYPHELSGGQKQRVGVARALAADPPIVLMDEPFGALDLLTRLEIQKEFRQLQQQLGKTVVFVTHDIQEAFFLAERIGLMHEGQLVELGSKQEFLRSPVPEVRAFVQCLETLKQSLILPGE
ncbi:ATP-binding cassette domain-containing protein [Pseudanabaena sp. PCC 6802]|uniref:ATP-binding cassette domain-containing protein n=1 Tax=Pseudanabaena sp. PCC 6802 TaxID=118173 RepID=UPI000347A00F|nr:ATP-binding cassette domain-containing protein [Pseudanabaena sp. PCC 6802]